MKSEDQCIENLSILETFLNEEKTELDSLNILFELCYLRPNIQNIKLSNDNSLIQILFEKLNSKKKEIEFDSVMVRKLINS